jgi:hypothetical protein
VRQIFKEYTMSTGDEDFGTRAQCVSEDELDRFIETKQEPPLTKPVKFDLRTGGKSDWNDMMCRLLAAECVKALTQPAPMVRVSDRVRYPQLLALMHKKYTRAWNKYSELRPRHGETEGARRLRVSTTLDKRDMEKRQRAGRVAKYTNRLDTVKTQISRGESVTAMRLAKRVLKTLGTDGMSSDEEIMDQTDQAIGFKVSKMSWRNDDIRKLLHRIDGLRQQLKSSRGAIALPRYRGERESGRGVKENLPYDFYNADFANKAIGSGKYLVNERSKSKWKGFAAWEALLK